MIYLDSSALMKLARVAVETWTLRDWLQAQAGEPMVTSELGRVEVLRAARRIGGPTPTEARGVVGALDLLPLDHAVQDLACDIAEPLLRALDALHLASAVLLGARLTAFVAYDHRLTAAARAAGLPVATPGQETPTDQS